MICQKNEKVEKGFHNQTAARTEIWTGRGLGSHVNVLQGSKKL